MLSADRSEDLNVTLPADQDHHQLRVPAKVTMGFFVGVVHSDRDANYCCPIASKDAYEFELQHVHSQSYQMQMPLAGSNLAVSPQRAPSCLGSVKQFRMLLTVPLSHYASSQPTLLGL